MTDFASGSVWFEVEVMLSSDSGRPKHVDVDEQGGWLQEPVRRALQDPQAVAPLQERIRTELDLPGGFEGVAFGRLRYWGQDVDRPAGEPILEDDVQRNRPPS